MYLDDIIIFGATFEEHMSRVQEILQCLRDANLKLQPSKCNLLQTQVDFLGHVINEDGVLPNPENVSKILNWSQPRSPTQVRQFLGMASYYRRFVKDFAKVAKPLVNLTCKNQVFKWTEESESAFKALKQVLSGPKIMAYPLQEGPFILDTDASDFAIGSVLSQVQNDKEMVISYVSRSLNKAEQNYCVTDRELLAVRYFVEYFRQYLLGRQFTVRTDHQALVWLFSLKEPKQRISRWIEILSAYNFSIEYRPGNKHGNADAMSRCPNPRDCTCNEPDNLESLRCGPCNKCKKRAQTMLSEWILPQHEDSAVRSIHGKKIDNYGKNLCYQFTFFLLAIFQLLWTFVKIPFNQCAIIRKVTTRSQHESKSTESETVQKNQRNSQQGQEDRLHLWCSKYSLGQMQRMQRVDKELGILLKWFQEGKRPPISDMVAEGPVLRYFWNQWCLLEMHDGLQHRKSFKPDGKNFELQLLVPKCLQKQIVYDMHNTILSAHLGSKKNLKRLLHHYYWYEVSLDVKQWVLQCDTCAAVKKPRKNPKAPMGSMRVGSPLDRVGIDILGPLPLTQRGNKYILVATDYFTKWVEAFPVPDQTAVTCADVLLNEFFSRYGTPIQLHSDQGRNFESDLFAELCKLLEVRKTRTTPRNPRCNGQTERFNSTLIHMLKCYLKNQHNEWDKYLGCLTGAYRASIHESTQLTPNLLMLGHEVRIPSEIKYGSRTCHPYEMVSSYGEYVTNIRGRMQEAHNLARKYLGTAAKRQKENYDVKASTNKYQVGDFVWYLSEARKGQQSVKLQMTYEGPCVIVQKLSELDFRLQLDGEGRRRVVHFNKLKPYVGSSPPKWAKSALKKASK